MFHYSIFLLLFFLFLGSHNGTQYDGLILCQNNCVSPDRLTGPTVMEHTRQHPWKLAKFPSKFSSFCKLGCQIFFSEEPKNTTCKTACDYYYRYKVTVGYSDVITEAQLECRDGCDIALQVCQAGYYCINGEMNPCLPGTFREAIPDVSEFSLELAHKCVDCPYGRYRSMDKGKSADDCSLCPVMKYANTTGNTDESQCLRCPAGKFTAEEGTRLCKCITPESCDLEVSVGEGSQTYFSGNASADYFRETIPFTGRCKMEGIRDILLRIIGVQSVFPCTVEFLLNSSPLSRCLLERYDGTYDKNPNLTEELFVRSIEFKGSDKTITKLRKVLTALYSTIELYSHYTQQKIPLHLISEPTIPRNSLHPAIPSLYKLLDLESQHLFIFECSKHSFLSVSRFHSQKTLLSPTLARSGGLGARDLRLRFLIYQLLQALSFLLSQDLVLSAKQLKMENIMVDDDMFIKLPLDLFVDGSQLNSPPPSPTDDPARNSPSTASSLSLLAVPRPVDFYEPLVIQWMKHKVSNFEYLMAVNRAAGRCLYDSLYHPILPWVTDFTRERPSLPPSHTSSFGTLNQGSQAQGAGGLRDLTKTKFRLSKGDRQLETTFSHSEPPHHIPESISELTYSIYMARRTPLHVLRRVVRDYFVPEHYPASMVRMYEWSPDECIPEFFFDTSVFSSIHKELGLRDLELPSFAPTPESFIAHHRSLLESDHVSLHLHRWIDLTFGHCLQGEQARLNLNVPLRQTLSNHDKIGVPTLEKNSGFVLLFPRPHPRRFLSSQLKEIERYSQPQPTPNTLHSTPTPPSFSTSLSQSLPPHEPVLLPTGVELSMLASQLTEDTSLSDLKRFINLDSFYTSASSPSPLPSLPNHISQSLSFLPSNRPSHHSHSSSINTHQLDSISLNIVGGGGGGGGGQVDKEQQIFSLSPSFSLAHTSCLSRAAWRDQESEGCKFAFEFNHFLDPVYSLSSIRPPNPEDLPPPLPKQPTVADEDFLLSFSLLQLSMNQPSLLNPSGSSPSSIQKSPQDELELLVSLGCIVAEISTGQPLLGRGDLLDLVDINSPSPSSYPVHTSYPHQQFFQRIFSRTKSLPLSLRRLIAMLVHPSPDLRPLPAEILQACSIQESETYTFLPAPAQLQQPTQFSISPHGAILPQFPSSSYPNLRSDPSLTSTGREPGQVLFPVSDSLVFGDPSQILQCRLNPQPSDALPSQSPSSVSPSLIVNQRSEFLAQHCPNLFPGYFRQAYELIGRLKLCRNKLHRFRLLLECLPVLMSLPSEGLGLILPPILDVLSDPEPFRGDASTDVSLPPSSLPSHSSTDSLSSPTSSSKHTTHSTSSPPPVQSLPLSDLEVGLILIPDYSALVDCLGARLGPEKTEKLVVPKIVIFLQKLLNADLLVRLLQSDLWSVIILRAGVRCFLRTFLPILLTYLTSGSLRNIVASFGLKDIKGLEVHCDFPMWATFSSIPSLSPSLSRKRSQSLSPYPTHPHSAHASSVVSSQVHHSKEKEKDWVHRCHPNTIVKVQAAAEQALLSLCEDSSLGKGLVSRYILPSLLCLLGVPLLATAGYGFKSPEIWFEDQRFLRKLVRKSFRSRASPIKLFTSSQSLISIDGPGTEHPYLDQLHQHSPDENTEIFRFLLQKMNASQTNSSDSIDSDAQLASDSDQINESIKEIGEDQDEGEDEELYSQEDLLSRPLQGTEIISHLPRQDLEELSKFVVSRATYDPQAMFVVNTVVGLSLRLGETVSSELILTKIFDDVLPGLESFFQPFPSADIIAALMEVILLLNGMLPSLSPRTISRYYLQGHNSKSSSLPRLLVNLPISPCVVPLDSSLACRKVSEVESLVECTRRHALHIALSRLLVSSCMIAGSHDCADYVLPSIDRFFQSFVSTHSFIPVESETMLKGLEIGAELFLPLMQLVPESFNVLVPNLNPKLELWIMCVGSETPRRSPPLPANIMPDINFEQDENSFVATSISSSATKKKGGFFDWLLDKPNKEKKRKDKYSVSSQPQTPRTNRTSFHISHSTLSTLPTQSSDTPIPLSPPPSYENYPAKSSLVNHGPTPAVSSGLGPTTVTLTVKPFTLESPLISNNSSDRDPRPSLVYSQEFPLHAVDSDDEVLDGETATSHDFLLEGDSNQIKPEVEFDEDKISDHDPVLSDLDSLIPLIRSSTEDPLEPLQSLLVQEDEIEEMEYDTNDTDSSFLLHSRLDTEDSYNSSLPQFPLFTDEELNSPLDLTDSSRFDSIHFPKGILSASRTHKRLVQGKFARQFKFRTKLGTFLQPSSPSYLLEEDITPATGTGAEESDREASTKHRQDLIWLLAGTGKWNIPKDIRDKQAHRAYQAAAKASLAHARANGQRISQFAMNDKPPEWTPAAGLSLTAPKIASDVVSETNSLFPLSMVSSSRWRVEGESSSDTSKGERGFTSSTATSMEGLSSSSLLTLDCSIKAMLVNANESLLLTSSRSGVRIWGLNSHPVEDLACLSLRDKPTNPSSPIPSAPPTYTPRIPFYLSFMGGSGGSHVCGCDGGAVHLWDIETSQKISSIYSSFSSHNSLSISNPNSQIFNHSLFNTYPQHSLLPSSVSSTPFDSTRESSPLHFSQLSLDTSTHNNGSASGGGTNSGSPNSFFSGFSCVSVVPTRIGLAPSVGVYGDEQILACQGNTLSHFDFRCPREASLLSLSDWHLFDPSLGSDSPPSNTSPSSSASTSYNQSSSSSTPSFPNLQYQQMLAWGQISALACSEHFIFMGSTNGWVCLLDRRKGRVLSREFSGHEMNILKVHFINDTHFLSTSDRAACVWTLTEGRGAGSVRLRKTFQLKNLPMSNSSNNPPLHPNGIILQSFDQPQNNGLAHSVLLQDLQLPVKQLHAFYCVSGNKVFAGKLSGIHSDAPLSSSSFTHSPTEGFFGTGPGGHGFGSNAGVGVGVVEEAGLTRSYILDPFRTRMKRQQVMAVSAALLPLRKLMLLGTEDGQVRALT